MQYRDDILPKATKNDLLRDLDDIDTYRASLLKELTNTPLTDRTAVNPGKALENTNRFAPKRSSLKTITRSDLSSSEDEQDRNFAIRVKKGSKREKVNSAVAKEYLASFEPFSLSLAKKDANVALHFITRITEASAVLGFNNASMLTMIVAKMDTSDAATNTWRSNLMKTNAIPRTLEAWIAAIQSECQIHRLKRHALLELKKFARRYVNILHATEKPDDNAAAIQFVESLNEFSQQILRHHKDFIEMDEKLALSVTYVIDFMENYLARQAEINFSVSKRKLDVQTNAKPKPKALVKKATVPSPSPIPTYAATAFTAATVGQAIPPPKRQEKKNCRYCHGDHDLDTCAKLKAKQLRELGLSDKSEKALVKNLRAK